MHWVLNIYSELSERDRAREMLSPGSKILALFGPASLMLCHRSLQ